MAISRLFYPWPDSLFDFSLSYAQEDRGKIKKLYRAIAEGRIFRPWMDCQKLMPGQNWPRAIQQTIEISRLLPWLFFETLDFKTWTLSRRDRAWTRSGYPVPRK